MVRRRRRRRRRKRRRTCRGDGLRRPKRRRAGHSSFPAWSPAVATARRAALVAALAAAT